jgi:hypothetical protein
MNINEKAIKLISKINRETSDKKLEWNVATVPSSLTEATECKIFVYFEAKYKNSTVAVYEKRLKYYHDEDTYSWAPEIYFAVINQHRVVLWEFSERNPALSGLFNTVREQVSDIDGMLDEMLI